MLVAEGFGYLLANAISQGRVCGISLPDSPNHLVNGHFVDESFLTLIKDEDNVVNALQCLDTFRLTSGSTIHGTKPFVIGSLPFPNLLGLANINGNGFNMGNLSFSGNPLCLLGLGCCALECGPCANREEVGVLDHQASLPCGKIPNLFQGVGRHP